MDIEERWWQKMVEYGFDNIPIKHKGYQNRQKYKYDAAFKHKVVDKVRLYMEENHCKLRRAIRELKIDVNYDSIRHWLKDF